MSDVVRIFVGVDANGHDAESCAALEWSVRKHASLTVEIEWMAQSHDRTSPWGGWDTSRWATPFSGFRWGIPARCGFQGRAIYTDSDVIFLGDVAELWRQPFAAGKALAIKPGAGWRMCVSLWDCAEAFFHVPSLNGLKGDPLAHASMLKAMQAGGWTQPFEGHWNCLDGEDFASVRDPAIKALHYTDMSCQPHQRHALPRLAARGETHWFVASGGRTRAHPRADVQELFDEVLAEAIANGYAVENYVPAEPFGPYKKAALTGYRGRAK